MPPDMDAMAGEVVLLLKAALAPLQEKIAVLEAKQAAPAVPDPTVAVLMSRVAVLEDRKPLPGPPGEPGPAGKDGADGTAGMTYQGVFVDGKSYQKGDVTTWGGSMWHANTETSAKPGDGSKDWTLACKHGRDGRDK